MGTIQSPKRIIVEDYPKENRSLVERLSGSINLFMDDVYRVISKNLNTYDNLNRELRTITVTVDSTGKPVQNLQFQNVLKTKLSGMIVIRVFNALPTSQPFITFAENSGVVTISNITGLTAGTSYQLVIEVIGD